MPSNLREAACHNIHWKTMGSSQQGLGRVQGGANMEQQLPGDSNPLRPAWMAGRV